MADSCNLGFTNLVQVTPDVRPALEEGLRALQPPPVEKAQFTGYKAVIDFDGNSNTSSVGCIAAC